MTRTHLWSVLAAVLGDTLVIAQTALAQNEQFISALVYRTEAMRPTACRSPTASPTITSS
jgi:hypothetical protein